MLNDHTPTRSIPSWEQLRSLSQNPYLDQEFSEQVSALKKNKSKIRYQVSRKFVTYFIKDPAFQKFLNFEYEDVIDVIADQVAHNKKIDPKALGKAKFKGLNRQFAQQPCTNYTAKCRAEKCLSMVGLDQPILVMGDDDLVSIELAKVGFTDITALDIDKRVIETIDTIKQQQNLEVQTFQYNLYDEAPKNLIRDYALIFIDPNYSIEGIKLFLEGALKLADNTKGTKIFLSVHLMSLLPSGLRELPDLLRGLNCKTLEFHHGFNIYPAPNKVKGLIRLVNQILIASKTLTTEGYSFPYLMSDAIVLEKA